MKQLGQRGSTTSLLIAFTIVLILLFGTASFAIWAFMSRQDFKNNVDQKIAAAVTVAQQQTSTQKDNQFAQSEKLPLKDYNGPSTYGSLDIKYPKTWSAYVTVSDQASTPIDGYFQPNYVPGIQSGAAFALRIQVVSDSYSQELSQFSDLVTSGAVTVSAYRAPKVPGTLGSRVDGQIEQNLQGSMVLFPLRDKTLKIWTEAPQFESDFNNNILPNLVFSP